VVLGELRDVVIENTGNGYEGDIIRYLNKGLLELDTEKETVKRQKTTVKDGVAPLPDDYLVIRNVYLNNHRLYKYGESNIPQQDSNGYPVYWTDDQENLYLVPPIASAEIEIVYTEKSLQMVNLTDENPVPYSDEFLVAFATWKTLLQTEGPTTDVQYWQGEAERERMMFKKIDTQRGRRPKNVKLRPYV
jgi:hypothetical protein